MNFENLTILWINHHNPDLILFDHRGNELRRLDLTQVNDYQRIHTLLPKLGVTRKCVDLNESCESWATSVPSECDENMNYMAANCARACNLCTPKGTPADAHPLGGGGLSGRACEDVAGRSKCEYWSTIGDCKTNQEYMREHCARSCGECTEQPARKDEL